MVNEGLLKKDSPRGVWEISDKGRRYLEQNG
jgi:restriction system protein